MKLFELQIRKTEENFIYADQDNRKPFFRLKATSDDRIHYSGILFLQKDPDNSVALLGSNVVKDQLLFKNAKGTTIKIKVFDVGGRAIKINNTILMNGLTNVNVSDLAAGVYVARISNAEGFTKTFRFIKL